MLLVYNWLPTSAQTLFVFCLWGWHVHRPVVIKQYSLLVFFYYAYTPKVSEVSGPNLKKDYILCPHPWEIWFALSKPPLGIGLTQSGYGVRVRPRLYMNLLDNYRTTISKPLKWTDLTNHRSLQKKSPFIVTGADWCSGVTVACIQWMGEGEKKQKTLKIFIVKQNILIMCK